MSPTKALTVLVALSVAPAVPAQQATPVVREGDALPGVGGGHVVTSLGSVSVNGSGGFSVSLVSSDGVDTRSSLFGSTAGGAPDVLRTEALIGSLDQTSFELFHGIDDVGSLCYSALVDDTGSAATNLDSAWSDGTLLALEGEPIPALPGSVWRSVSRPSVTRDGKVVWVGGIDDAVSGVSQGNGLFLDGIALLKSFDSVPGIPFPLTSNGVDLDARFSEAGTSYITAVDVDSGSSADDGWLVVDGAPVTLSGSVVAEGQPVPAAVGGLAGESWDNFDFFGINEAGDVFWSGDTDANASVDEYLCLDGVIIHREGDTLDGAVLTGSIEAAAMNEVGDVAFIWDVEVAGGGDVEALFLDDELLIREGDAVDLDGDGSIDAGATLAGFVGSTVAVNAEGDVYFTADVDTAGTPTTSDDVEVLYVIERTGPSVVAFGLVHSPVGDAVLETDPMDPQFLTVHSLGSSGMDGVRVSLGEVAAFTSRGPVAFDPQVLPDGAFIETTTRAPVDGVPDQVVLVSRCEVVGGVVQVSVDFSAVGATTHTISVYDDGDLVAQVAGHSGPAYTVASLPAGALREYPDEDNPKCLIYIPPRDDSVFSIVGGPTVVGDVIEVAQENKTKTVGRLSSVTIVGSDVGEIVIDQEQIKLFDHFQSALGDAVLTATDDFVSPSLVVSNLGSSGQDGIQLDIPGADSFDVSWDPLDPGAPRGAWIQAEAFGSLAGVPDQPLGSARVTKGAVGYDVTADFTSIGSPTQHVQLFDQGTLVLDLPGHSGLVATASAWPNKLGKLGGTTECIVSCSPVGTSFTIDGNAYIGDELRILAESDGNAVDDKSTFEITGADLGEILIVGESSSQKPFENLGDALDGASGLPHLVGLGPLTSNSANAFSLTNAAPNALAVLFVGLADTPVPFKGGTLHPVPVFVSVTLITSGTGTLTIPFTWPSGVPGSFELVVQYAIADGGAVNGVALSNAVIGTTP